MGNVFNVDAISGDLTTVGSITSTSTTSGFLLPKLTTTERDAIAFPATGLQIFNTSTNQTEFYNGTIWTAVGGITPAAGASGAVQFNSFGSFNADTSNLFWDDTNNALGIGTNIPNATSVLDLTSTTKGFLTPRMTTTQRNAIASPTTGLQIYNTTTAQPEVYNGTLWSSMGGGGTPGGSTGAVQFNNASAFAGDTANLFWDDSNNRLGIGINAPVTSLHIFASNTSTDPLITLEQNSTGNGWMRFARNGSEGFVGFDNAGSFNLSSGGGVAKVWNVGGTGQLRIDGAPITLASNGSMTIIGSTSVQVQTGGAGSFVFDTNGGGSAAALWKSASAPATSGVNAVKIYANSTTNTLLASQNNVAFAPLMISSLSTQTGTYTILPTDHTILGDATSASFAMTLPSVSQNTGRIFTVKKINSNANTVTVTPASGTIDGAASLILSAQYQAVTVQSDGTNWFSLDTLGGSGTSGFVLTSNGSGTNPSYKPSGVGNVGSVAGTGTVTPDASTASTFSPSSVTGNLTFNGPTNGVDGQKITFRLLQDGTGHSVTFNTGAGNFRFSTDLPSFSASGANLTDYVAAVFNSGANRWDIISVIQGF